MSLQVVTSGNPIRIGFLLVPGYSAIAFSTALEPLRMANQLTGQKLFEWAVITRDGKPVRASNGLAVGPDTAMHEAAHLDMLFVCGGINIHEACDKTILAWLRQLARHDVALGAVCTGTYLLARAGVLNGYRCAIHWENISSIHEELLFPHTTFAPELFVVDRDRYTCSGGVAPLDMMLYLISLRFGQTLAEEISEEFIHERIRNMSDIQRIPLHAHLGTSQPKLAAAVLLMEANTEEPLSLYELATYVKVSRRQLERMFKRYLYCAPARYYMELRLRRARQLLLQTNKSIIEVALACGFSSSPHFSKCYHNFFGYPPSNERYGHRRAVAVERNRAANA